MSLCFYTSAKKKKKKKVVALENYETDARIIYAQEITSSILSFLAMVTCFKFVLPSSLNFFIGPYNRGNISQSGKTETKLKACTSGLCPVVLNIHILAKSQMTKINHHNCKI